MMVIEDTFQPGTDTRCASSIDVDVIVLLNVAIVLFEFRNSPALSFRLRVDTVGATVVSLQPNRVRIIHDSLCRLRSPATVNGVCEYTQPSRGIHRVLTTAL